MTMVQWLNKNSRGLAKAGLYIGGGLALGAPLIEGAKDLFDGKSFDQAAKTITYNATGYLPGAGMSTVKLREVAIRDTVGAVAILIARKL